MGRMRNALVKEESLRKPQTPNPHSLTLKPQTLQGYLAQKKAPPLLGPP